MEKCSSKGDALNNWSMTDECAHLGKPTGGTPIRTYGIGGNGVTESKTNATYTREGLGISTNNGEQIFGPGGTIGGPSTSGSSGGINPSTGYIDSDGKLNSWGVPENDPNATLRPLEESDFGAESIQDGGNVSSALSGQGALGTSGTQSPATSAPPTPPSTRPYLWKYQ
jgi:hypothetical protein